MKQKELEGIFGMIEAQAQMLGKLKRELEQQGFESEEIILLACNFQDNLMNMNDAREIERREQELRKAEAEQLNSILAKLTGGFVNPFEN